MAEFTELSVTTLANIRYSLDWTALTSQIKKQQLEKIHTRPAKKK